jgi:phage regulator Rha-like protein
MNALTTLNTNANLTMSSREIAELTGKEHKNVLADARKMLGELGLAAADFSATAQVPGPNNSIRTVEVFNLPKDLTITLVSGYNVQMRYAITKRWMELEAQQAPRLPTTFAEALRLAAELEEQKETLRLENEALKPMAQVGAAVGVRKRTTVLDFARKLPGVNTMQVQNKLAELGHMRKRKNAWAVYSASKKYFNEGFDHKGFSVITVTDKGMELISRLYLNGELQMLKGETPVSAAELEAKLNA